MAEKKKVELTDAELLAAARIAYSEPFAQEFWDELAARLFPKSSVEVNPLPRRDSGTI